jgi:hypothetical protein
MSALIEKAVVIADASSGLIDDVSVAKHLLPANAVRKAINVVFDRPRGGVSQRYGTTIIGSAIAAQTVNGLHNYRSSTPANHRLFTQVGTVAYSLEANVWTSSLTGLTNIKTRFFTYLDTMAILNGTDAVKGWTGSAWITTGGNLDIANFPVTKFATVMNSRVLAAGNPSAPDTVYESSLEAGGAISWTSGNKSFKVSPNDGAGSLKGLAGNGRVALLFKERGLYRYDDTELQRIGYVGTTSHESIVTDDNGTTHFFGQGANGVGFYKTTGGTPTKSSRAIQKYVEAIDPAYYASIAGYTNGLVVEWDVGSITVDGVTYANACFVQSISDRTWTVFNRADSFRVFSQYITSTGGMTVVGGDTDGSIQTINSGNTDNGSPISAECEYAATVFSTRGRTKSPTQLVTMAEHYQGLTAHMKVDDGKFLQFGSITDRNQLHMLNSVGKFRGHEFILKLTSVNSGIPWEFAGFEFPANTIMDEGYRPN